MAEESNILDFLSSVKGGTFGVQLIALTEPKMNKTGNTFYGRVMKATYMLNIALGYNYEKVVNNRLEKSGEVPDFKAAAPRGREWLIPNYVLRSVSDHEQNYLRITCRLNTITKTAYIVDANDLKKAHIATDEEMEVIKNFLPKKKPCAKQIASGMTEENEVIVRDFKFQNIVLLKQGENEYNASHLPLGLLMRTFDKK